MWDFPPWETLPIGEADCDCGVEVASGGGGRGDDGEGDADGETPSDLEDGAEGGGADWVFRVEVEGGDGGDAGEDVEEDARGFGHAFAEDTRSVVR